MNWDSEDTREFQAKNPLGVSTSKWTVGAIGEDNSLHDHLAIAPNMRTGADWAANLMLHGYFDAGYTTPEAIGNRWAGDATGGYGDSVRRIMGLEPNTQLDFVKDGNSLLSAMAIMENGNPARMIPQFYFVPSILKAKLA